MWMLYINCVLWVDRLCSTVLLSVCMRVLLANKCLCGWVGWVGGWVCMLGTKRADVYATAAQVKQQRAIENLLFAIERC